MSYVISDLCTGCSLCARNCPVSAVNGEYKMQHIIDNRVCINCGVCGRVCSKKAIKDENGNLCKRVLKSKWGKATVNEDKCNGCGLCINICNRNCLKMTKSSESNKKVYAKLTKTTKCVACNMCVSVCPSKAIKISVV